jgi:membrane associated rhomboid family serine protease
VDTVLVFEIGELISKRVGHAYSALAECCTDLNTFFLEELWESQNKDEDGSRDTTTPHSHTAQEAQDQSQYTCSQKPRTWYEYIFPNFIDNSVIMKITGTQALVYAYEVLAQPASLDWDHWLYDMGAAWGPAIVYDHDLWRLLCPVLLHANFSHFACNALMQLRLGFRVEAVLGSTRFGLFYFGSAIMANLLSATIDPLKLSVGASTSGFGIIGANLTLMFIQWHKLTPYYKGMTVVYAALVVGSFFMTPVSVDFIGHFAGMVSGASLTILLIPAKYRETLNLSNEGLTYKDVAAWTTMVVCAATGMYHWCKLPIPT